MSTARRCLYAATFAFAAVFLVTQSAAAGSASQCVEDGHPTTKPTRVLANPNIAVIFWNSSVWPELANNAFFFYSDLEISSYIKSLTNDYGVSTGIFRGVTTITPQTRPICVDGGCVLSKQMIDAEIAAQIKAGNIWSPEQDGVDSSGYAQNLLYVIHLPPNLILLDENGNIQCGFHNEFIEPDPPHHHAAIAYLADMSPSSTCAGQQQYSGMGPINDLFQAASHEVIEAVVNPYKSLHDNGEIADYCQCNTHYTGVAGVGGTADVGAGHGTAAWTMFPGTWRTWVVQQPYMLSSQGCQTMQIYPATALNAANSSGFSYSHTSGDLSEFWAPVTGTLEDKVWTSAGWSTDTVYTGGPIVANSEVAVSSLSPINTDIFYVGPSGNVEFTSLTFGQSPIALTGPGGATGATFLSPPGGGISAVAAGSGAMNVFVADNGNSLHGLNWSAGASGTGWSVFPADPLATNVPPGAAIAAIRRSNLNADIFWIGADGGVWHLSSVAFGTWSLEEIPGTVGLSSPGASIAATARVWDKLDLFFMTTSGTAMTAFWSEDTNAWGVQATVGTANFAATVAAVSRSPYNIDTFFVGTSGPVDASWTDWDAPSSGWSLINLQSGGGSFIIGTPIAATTRAAANLDVFEFSKTGASYTESYSGLFGIWNGGPN